MRVIRNFPNLRRNFNIDGHDSEGISMLKYLDTLSKGKNEITKYIVVKIAAGSRCYYGLQYF
jgi:hypothetical protein